MKKRSQIRNYKYGRSGDGVILASSSNAEIGKRKQSPHEEFNSECDPSHLQGHICDMNAYHKGNK